MSNVYQQMMLGCSYYYRDVGFANPHAWNVSNPDQFMALNDGYNIVTLDVLNDEQWGFKQAATCPAKLSYDRRMICQFAFEDSQGMACLVYITFGGAIPLMGEPATTKHVGLKFDGFHAYGTCGDGAAQTLKDLGLYPSGNHALWRIVFIPKTEIRYYYIDQHATKKLWEYKGSITSGLPSGEADSSGNIIESFYCKKLTATGAGVLVFYLENWEFLMI